MTLKQRTTIMIKEKKHDYFYKAIAFSLLIIIGLFIFQTFGSLVVQLLKPDIPILSFQDLRWEHLTVISWFSMLFLVPLSLIFYIAVDKYELNEIGITGKSYKVALQCLTGFVIIVGFFFFYIFTIEALDYVYIAYQKPKKNIFNVAFWPFYRPKRGNIN